LSFHLSTIPVLESLAQSSEAVKSQVLTEPVFALSEPYFGVNLRPQNPIQHALTVDLFETANLFPYLEKQEKLALVNPILHFQFVDLFQNSLRIRI
jgi:hypothetical protein